VESPASIWPEIVIPLQPSNTVAPGQDVVQPLLSTTEVVNLATVMVSKAQDEDSNTTPSSPPALTIPSPLPELAQSVHVPTQKIDETASKTGSHVEEKYPTSLMKDVDSPPASPQESVHPPNPTQAEGTMSTGAPVSPPIAVPVSVPLTAVPLAPEPAVGVVESSPAAGVETPAPDASETLARASVVDSAAPALASVQSTPHPDGSASVPADFVESSGANTDQPEKMSVISPSSLAAGTEIKTETAFASVSKGEPEAETNDLATIWADSMVALDQMDAPIVQSAQPMEPALQPVTASPGAVSQPSAPAGAATAPLVDPVANTAQPLPTAPVKAPLSPTVAASSEAEAATIPMWEQFARNSSFFTDSAAPDLSLRDSAVFDSPPPSPRAPAASKSLDTPVRLPSLETSSASPSPDAPAVLLHLDAPTIPPNSDTPAIPSNSDAPAVPSSSSTSTVPPRATASPAPRPAHVRKASLDARRAVEARRAQDGRRRVNPFAALGKLFRFGKGRKRNAAV
jgi:hypothetical protein